MQPKARFIRWSGVPCESLDRLDSNGVSKYIYLYGTYGNVKYRVYSPCQFKCQFDSISNTEQIFSSSIITTLETF